MKKAPYIALLLGLATLVACNQSLKPSSESRELEETQKIHEVLGTLTPIAPGVLASAKPNGITLVFFPAKFSPESLAALEGLTSYITGASGGDRQGVHTWSALGVEVGNMDERTKLDIRRLVAKAVDAHKQFTQLQTNEIRIQGSDYDSGLTCTAAASAWPTSWSPGAKAEAWVSCSRYWTDTFARARARAGNNRDSDYDSGRYGSSAFAVAYVGDSYHYCTSSSEATGYYWISDWARILDAIAYASNYGC